MPMYGAEINPQSPTRTEQVQPQCHFLRTNGGVNGRYNFGDGFDRHLSIKRI
jgi:hypothetical protein